VLWVYVVLGEDAEPSEALRDQLRALVVDRLGKSFRPSAVRFTAALPKTRSAKVLRRAVQAVAVARDPGDLSSLEDPSTLDALRDAR
jgi:acetyl-CoA synthetase